MNELTKSSEQTFAQMAASPNAKSTTAFLWVFLGSLVSSFLASLVQGPIMRQMMQQYSGNAPFPFGRADAGGTLIRAICGAPIAAVISVVIFAAIVGWCSFWQEHLEEQEHMIKWHTPVQRSGPPIP